ncbi:MAG: hypothetical protein ACXABY_13545, partial [Candidatus Thorarchaeota archaeon]
MAANQGNTQRKEQQDRKDGRRWTIQGLFILFFISTLMFLFPFPNWSVELANWMFAETTQSLLRGMIAMGL